MHSCLHRDSGAGTRTTGLRNPLFHWRLSVNCTFFRWTYFLMFNMSLEISSLMFKVRELWFHEGSRLADMCINLHTVYKCYRHSLSLVLRLIFLNYMKTRVFVLHALYYKSCTCQYSMNTLPYTTNSIVCCFISFRN